MHLKKRTAATLIVLSSLLTLLLSATDGIEIGSAAPSAVHESFLPAIQTPSIDFSISHVEISQAVQKVDNSVPLVSGRSTLMRVFAVLATGDSPGNIIVSLTASRNAVPLGSVTSAQGSVPLSPSRGNFNSTFNLLLPSSWLSGDVVIVAKVDAGDSVSESDENNNTLQTAVSFNVVPRLDVRIVPINYTHQGGTDPGGYPGQADDRIKDWISRAFPVDQVNASFRTPYLGFQGNLDQGSEWNRLLDDVSDLKLFDGAPSSQFYYGLVPILNGGNQWFNSGIAGIGWIGYRAAVGLNLPSLDGTGILAGHEIGHNMGRRHAPCGVTGTDTSYPYAGASIGEYGIEIDGTTASLLGPSNYVDMMSYCSPEWVSDYTYVALYNNQRAVGLTETRPSEHGLIVRARLDDGGFASIKPVYALKHIPFEEPTYSRYQIHLLDNSGAILATRQAAVLEATEDQVSSTAFYASFPIPDGQVATIQLARLGEVMEQRQLATTAAAPASQVILREGNTTNSLAWGSPDTPAVVRYTADDGESWMTLGLDMLGGQLEFDRQMLPQGAGRFEVVLADSVQTSPYTVTMDPSGQE